LSHYQLRSSVYMSTSSPSTSPPPSDICTLSLHDALPIFGARQSLQALRASLAVLSGRPRPSVCTVDSVAPWRPLRSTGPLGPLLDRKSTRLNSSHVSISYAVFCLKKKTSASLRTTSHMC